MARTIKKMWIGAKWFLKQLTLTPYRIRQCSVQIHTANDCYFLVRTSAIDPEPSVLSQAHSYAIKYEPDESLRG